MTLQEAKEYTTWLSTMFLFGYIVISIINVIYNSSPLDRDDSDQQGWFMSRSGLAIRTDYKTGCQFYESRNGTLTPRLDGNFNQLGCK